MRGLYRGKGCCRSAVTGSRIALTEKGAEERDGLVLGAVDAIGDSMVRCWIYR